jgi:hypothetical protein
MVKSGSKAIYLFSFAALGVLCLFLSLNRHSKAGLFNYHAEVWADKAGYFVYLPAAWHYGFQASRFPEGIDTLCGNGFRLDLANDKVRTKYFYGTALMQAPFFLGADAVAALTGRPRDGFSLPYQKAVNVAAVAWLMAALMLLWSLLRRRFGGRAALLTLVAIFAGTNLYYYSIDETGMSHVYSFFLFAAWLGWTERLARHPDPGVISGVTGGLIAGLILVTRPSNVLFLPVILFFHTGMWKNVGSRMKLLLKPRIWMPALAMAILVIIPQLMYWRYLDGQWLMDTYPGEGFNWMQPQLARSWLAPMHGLLTYNPLYLLILAAFIIFLKTRSPEGIVIPLFFLAISWVSAAWWDPGFGCSFGGRNYTEYLALFAFPLAAFVQRMESWKPVYRNLLYGFGILMIAWNLKLIYTFDECFPGAEPWDWESFIRLLSSPTL